MADFDSQAALNRSIQNAEATPPTFGGSVFNSLKGAFQGVTELGIQKGYIARSPETLAFEQAYSKIQFENQTEEQLLSTGQMAIRKAASFIPNLIGGLLDPISAATGYAGGAAASAAIRTAAPRVVERAALRRAFVEELGTKAGTAAVPRTIGEVGVAAAHGGATLGAYSVPGAYFGTENAKDMAVEVGSNAAMGMAFGVAGYGMGVLWHGLFPKAGKTPIPGTPEVSVHLADLNGAFERGEVSKPEYELMRDYLTNPDDPSIPKRFSEVLLKRGHEINSATYQAYFEMLSADDMANLKNIFPTELANHELATDKDALSQFTLHNRLDELRKNPELVNGLHGYVDTMEHRLKESEATIKEANETVERAINELPEDENGVHIEPWDRFSPEQVSLKSKHGRMSLSESENGELSVKGVRLFDPSGVRGLSREITDRSERSPFGKGHGKALYKMAIDYAYTHKLKFVSDQQISSEAMRVYESLEKEGYKFKKNPTTYLKAAEGRERAHYTVTNARPIFELIESPAKLLSPKTELQHIKNKLLPEKGLRKDFHQTKEYQRLTELADHWPQAKALLDRVHLENDIERQEAFRDVAKAFVDVLNSNIDRFATPERVSNYLRERIAQVTTDSGEKRYAGKVVPLSEIERAVKEARRIPVDEDAVLEDYAESVKNSESESAMTDYSEARERYEQFKAAIEGLEKLEEEKITLYRGEGKNRPGGIWYTKNIESAKGYAKYSEGKVFSIKVSPEELENLFEEMGEGAFNEHKFIGTDKELEELNKRRGEHKEENKSPLEQMINCFGRQ